MPGQSPLSPNLRPSLLHATHHTNTSDGTVHSHHAHDIVIHPTCDPSSASIHGPRDINGVGTYGTNGNPLATMAPSSLGHPVLDGHMNSYYPIASPHVPPNPVPVPMSVTGAHAQGADFTPTAETNYQYPPTTYAVPSTSASNQTIVSTTPFINTSPTSGSFAGNIRSAPDFTGYTG
jgi:hypothetical protein